MKLTREEQEPHIWINAADDYAEVYTEVPSEIRRWRRVALENQEVSVTEVGGYGLRVRLPKSRLKISWSSRRKGASPETLAKARAAKAAKNGARDVA